MLVIQNLALIECNKTPKYNLQYPARILMGRSMRSLLSTKKNLLKPKFSTTESYKNSISNQKLQKKYHDKSYVNLEKLRPYQQIYIQTDHRN